MPSYRFPILIWPHYAGGYTACLVEDSANIAAIGPTHSAAAGQLKELLLWRYRRAPWLPKPDFMDPELIWFKVEVRPEYQAHNRVSPVRQTVPIRVPCVRGTDSAGLLVCAVPTLGIRFNYHEEKSLSTLVSQYVQADLKGLTPQQLARHLPPPGAELDSVVILVRHELVEREPPLEVPELMAVAGPIGSRASRARLSRPWQRDQQVAALVKMLSGERSSVLILGETGAGKTSVLMEAVREAERRPPPKEDADPNEEPSEATKNRFWLTSASALIAGMQYLGQWQARCEQIIDELNGIEGVLCVENLLDLVRTGGLGPNDSIAAFLMPFIQRGELRLIGEATPAELDACRRVLPSFAELFQVLEIPPFSREQAVAALDQLAGALRQNLNVDYDRLAVEQIHRLFSRFMPYHSFPGRAAAFTSELFYHASRGKDRTITGKRVMGRFIKLTGLPELFLRDNLPLKHEDVVAELRAKVIGQEDACRAAASVITTFKAGLNDPGRPLGVLLFCGPTGVGKTELAKTISEFLFGHGDQKDRMVRLDMSEYAGPGAAERLIGPPFGEPSDLIKRLRQQPFTVVLLDEIEKAAPEVFDVLLGVFDEGRLTDRYGRLTTFRSALIVMTSNIGADRMQPFGLSKQPPGTYDSEVMSFFRPEFFNRIDAVVNFNPLSADSIRRIAESELGRIAKREGLEQRNLRLRWTQAVLKLVCAEGFDERYGARPLQRVIETRIVTPLAKYLAEHHELHTGTLTIDLSANNAIIVAHDGHPTPANSATVI